jgi:hypothetical protein
MSSPVAELCLTFKLDESIAVAAREGEYPPISRQQRLVLAHKIARIDGITLGEAHRQIHEQFRVW